MFLGQNWWVWRLTLRVKKEREFHERMSRPMQPHERTHSGCTQYVLFWGFGQWEPRFRQCRWVTLPSL